MSDLRVSHPNNGDLLRYLEGEASASEAKRIQAHLAACWQCRTEVEELQRTIAECVRYRRNVLQSILPEPPAPWGSLDRKMAEWDEQQRSRRRWWEGLRVALSRPRAWAAATAVVLVAAVLVDHLRNAPSVQAAELLRKASAAESTAPAPRRLQLRTSRQTLTRVIGQPLETAAAESLKARFQRVGYSWEDPLSARSFAAWRDTLADKHDEVTRLRDPKQPGRSFFRIRTRTESSELVDASLKLREADLRPVESELRFADREWVQISAFDAIPAPPAEPLAEARAPANVAPAPDLVVERTPAMVEGSATPGDELRVLAALRRLDADLGAPVEVRRAGGTVTVSGVGIDPQLQERIEGELGDMPKVAVAFADPGQSPPPPAGLAAPAPPPRLDVGSLQSRLERQLGGRAAYEQFVNRVLETSDAVMARAHALRRLAQRFAPETEALLTAEERRVLTDLRRQHATALAAQAVRLEQEAAPALAALGGAAGPGSVWAGSWQQATEKLFQQARRTETLIAVMLGGAAGGTAVDRLPAELLASLAQLKTGAEEYARGTM